MGFWARDKADVEDRWSGLGGYVYTPPPPVRYECPVCRQDFAELEELRRHRFERHPLRQPALLLRGRAAGGLPFKLMTPLDPGDVIVVDAAECSLNGHTVALSDLGPTLAALRSEFVEVALGNQGVITRCPLDFRIAPEADLAGVEEAFLRMARERALDHDALARFIAECRRHPGAMGYCDGLCHYLYGVMAKEGAAGSGLHRDQYGARYLQAADELAGFERPLARVVRALVAFHFNHFHDAERLASEGALRHAAGAFGSLLQGLPWHYQDAFSPAPGGAVEDLLTDQETLQILADASQGLVQLKEHAQDLQDRWRTAPQGYDRLKRALLAGEALAAREDADSRKAARALAREWVGQADAGAWAEAVLEKTRTP